MLHARALNNAKNRYSIGYVVFIISFRSIVIHLYPGFVYLSFLTSINNFVEMLDVNYADCRTRRRDCRQATATTSAAGVFMNYITYYVTIIDDFLNVDYVIVIVFYAGKCYVVYSDCNELHRSEMKRSSYEFEGS